MRLKKLFASILAFCMILSTMGFSVFAEVPEGTVATVKGVAYTDLQEAIKAAAPAGVVDIQADITIEEWVMIAESLTIGNDDLITLVIDGMTINGNGHTLTINSIESAGNGGRLFYDATNLNINNLTIKYADGLDGAIGLKAGTIENVTFDGCTYGVIPQTGEVKIKDCTFKTNGTSIYFEEERDGLVVTGCTFENIATANVILLRGDVEFTNNTVISGRTVNVVSGSPVVTGNDFNDVRFKVYNVATATIENNEIANIEIGDTTAAVNSTFTNNTLSEEAETVLKDAGVLPDDGSSDEETAVFTVTLGALSSESDTLDGALHAFDQWAPNMSLLGYPVITLNDDHEFDAPVVVDGEYPITIDLNGKTMTYNSTVQGEAMITNKGDLTINDSVGTGVINYNYTGAADPSYGKGNYTISNGGKLTVNGGKITIANLRQHAKYPIDNNSTSGDAILVINGGHLYNYNTSAIRQFCNSTTNQNSVTINGGTIEGYCAIWVQNPGKKTVNGALSITGGEIKTTAAAYVNGTSELKDVGSKIYCTIDGEGGAWSETSSVSITGGTINENVNLEANAPVDVTIGENATFNGYVKTAVSTVVLAQTKNANGDIVGEYADFESALAAACADASVARIEILGDITQVPQNIGVTYNVAEGQNLTIGVPEGAEYTIDIDRSATTEGATKTFSIYLRNANSSLTIGEGLTMKGLDILADGFATNNNELIIDGTLYALSLKEWTSGNGITINETGKVVLGYGDGQFDLAYGNGYVTINGDGSKTEPQFKAGYSGTRGNGNTLNLNDTYFEGGAWFKVNGSNGTFNIDNSIMEVSGGRGDLTIASTGNVFNLTNGSELKVNKLTLGENNELCIDGTSQVTVTTLTGNGKITIDAANLTAGATPIVGNASGFAGSIEVVNNSQLKAEIDENGNLVLVIPAVAKIGDVKYMTLADAFAAAQDGDTVKLIGDVEMTSSATISGKTLTLDLGEYTIYDKSTTVLTSEDGVWGLIELKDNANLTVCGDGAIECNYADTRNGWTGMAYCINVDNTSELTVNSGSFKNSNGGIQTAGKVTVNNGTFVSHNGGTCIMATYSDANVTVNDGIFKDSVEESDVYTGSGAVWGGFGATINIKGGTYDFAADPEHDNIVWTLFPAQNAIAGYGENANMTVTGGTFVNFNPATDVIVDYSASAGFTYGSVVAEGHASIENLSGNYVVGVKPTATVNNLGDMTISAGDYMVYGNGDNTEDMPLSFVMQFLADQDEEDMKTSPYADWYGDFVITFTGIENESFVADGCYLAGHYGTFGWVKVPVDGMEIEEGVRYPVMLGVGMGQKYTYICSDVEDFKCALYLPQEIIDANPNLKVNLELSVVDNSKGEDAAKEALIKNETIYKVNDIEYTAEDFAIVTPVAKIGEVKYASLAKAFATAKAGDVITLLEDVTLDEMLTVDADDNIVLDLNGKKIDAGLDTTRTDDGHLYAFTNYGTLTVKDSVGTGEINARGNFNYGVMTLENGTINAIDGNGGYGVRNYENASFTLDGGKIATTCEDDNKVNEGGYDATPVRVDNGASFVMNNGEIVNVCDFTMGIENRGTTTIKGGTVTSIHTTIANYNNMEISGGIFVNNGIEGITAHALWAAAGTTTITGGTFNGKDNYNGFNVDASEGAVVNISGGNFLNVHSGSLYGDGTISVSGGTFFDKISENRVAEGYKVVANEDGTYGVVAAPEEDGILDKLLVICDMEIKAGENGTKYYPVHIYSGIDSLKYKEVGFKVVATNKKTPQVVNLTLDTTVVYRSMKVTDFDGIVKLYKASDLGGAYMFGKELLFTAGNWTNADTEIQITPYAIDLNGKEITGTTKLVTNEIIQDANPKYELFKEVK